MTQIDRIEAKLDEMMEMLATLIDALTDEDDEQAFDLNGQPLPRQRNEDEPL